MEKKDFTRYSLKSNIMHSIVFRIDYQGLIDVEFFVKLFIEAFRGSFGIYETAYHNRVDFLLTSYQEISESLSLPIKEIEQQIVHRFSEFTIGSDRINLDVSKYYTVLQVDCINYESIDPYLIFFAEYCSFIHAKNDFLQVKRLGLRKVGTSLYDKTTDLREDFEPEYFDFDFGKAGFASVKRELRDLLEAADGIRIDFRRGFESGQVIDNDGNPVPKYQAILDFDGIVSEDDLKALQFKTDPKKLLTLLNNTYLFEIFKMSVTADFLERNSKK